MKNTLFIVEILGLVLIIVGIVVAADDMAYNEVVAGAAIVGGIAMITNGFDIWRKS